MRTLLLVLAVTLLTCSLGLDGTFAEDEPPEGPAPAAQVPPFGLDDIAAPEGTLPEGWKAGTPAAGAPTAEALMKLATDAGLDAAKVTARAVALAKGEGETTVGGVAAWLALDAGNEAFGPALKSAVETGGWLVKPIGTPLRLLITSAGSEAAAKELQTWQVDVTVRRLCDRCLETFKEAQQQFDPHSQAETARKAQAMLAAASQTEPEAAYAHAIIAQMVQRDHPDAAMEHNRKALKKDAPVQPPAEWIVRAAFNVGGALLTTGDAAQVDEALEVLSRAVALEDKTEDPFQRFGNRYNLACAYARKGQLDPAFQHLETCLATLKTAWEKDKQKSFSGMSQLEYPRHYEHAKLIDSDMDELRKDARWAPLMAKLDPYAPAAAQPEKSKKESDDDK